MQRANTPAHPLRFVLALAGLAVAALSPSLAGAEKSADAAARPEAGAIRYIYVVPMSHLDIGFTDSVPELITLSKQYIDDAMDFADQYPQYKWTIESVWQLDQWLSQSDEAEIDRLRALIAQDRIEVMAGYGNMHQGKLGFEQFNRFIYPAREYETAWNLDLDTIISDDVPGSSVALPQVLRKNGVRNLVAGINTVFGGKPDIPVSDYLFNWRGIDGSEVLTWVSVKSYAEGIFTWRIGAPYDKMVEATSAVLNYYESNGYAYDSVLVLMGFDNDGADKITGNGLPNIERWNAEHEWPQIIVATPKDFFDHVRATYGDDGFTTYSGDWSGLWENNDSRYPVTTAQDRTTKEMLPQAETLAAVTSALRPAVPYPADDIDRAYRDLNELDEHSGPGGGATDLTVEQIETNNAWFFDQSTRAYTYARDLMRSRLAVLARDIPTTGRTLVVYNGLSWPRTDLVAVPRPQGGAKAAAPFRLVDLETGQTVAMQIDAECNCPVFLARDVPALGFRLYGVVPAAKGPATPRAVAANEIANEYYRVTVDPETGVITSIRDKINGRELVDAEADVGFNQLVKASQDNAFVWGVWEPVPAGEVTVTSRPGPVVKQLVITRSESPHAETVITLVQGVPRVSIRNRLLRERTTYADQDTFAWWYYDAMPLALGSDFTSRFQGPNGWLVPQQDWIPGSRHNTRVVRHGSDLRAPDGFGVTIANRQSYLAGIGTIAWWSAAQPSVPTLYQNIYTRQDGTDTNEGWRDFETWEPGAPEVYDFNFALTSGGGGFDAVAAERFAAGYALPMQTTTIRAAQPGTLPGPVRSLIGISAPNVALVTLKRAEFDNPSGRDLILRLQEISGTAATDVEITLPFAVTAAETNGLGEQRTDAQPLPVSPLKVSLAPYETLTVRLVR